MEKLKAPRAQTPKKTVAPDFHSSREFNMMLCGSASMETITAINYIKSLFFIPLLNIRLHNAPRTRSPCFTFHACACSAENSNKSA